MNDLRRINRLLLYVPVVPCTCWLIMLIAGIIRCGCLPHYGNPDPASLNIDFLDAIALLPATRSFITIPLSMLLSIHLLVSKTALEPADIRAVILSGTSIVLVIGLRILMPASFDWITD